ncbi:MAG: hypothetical protein JXA69_08165 [Phycisphaerae bacterium]|nr:hypothetical protein [Phycisphaerae bacterium]
MSSRTAHDRPRVIVVASGDSERCEDVLRALMEAQIETIRVPNVYAALAEIIVNPKLPPLAVLVDADCLDSSEGEFFTLAGRYVDRGYLRLIAGKKGHPLPASLAAVEAGASMLDADELPAWIDAVRQLAPPEPAAAPTAVTPDPIRPRAQRAPTRLNRLDRLGDSETQEPELPPRMRASAPAEPIDVEEPLAFELPAEIEEPLETGDDPAQPEAFEEQALAEPPIAPAEPESSATAPTESLPEEGDDGTIPVPWRPAPNRPARTPPNPGRDEEQADERSDRDVRLTKEEIDALLGSRGEMPDPQRRAQ